MRRSRRSPPARWSRGSSKLSGISRAWVETHHRLYRGRSRSGTSPRGSRGTSTSRRRPGVLGRSGAEGRPDVRNQRDHTRELYFAHLGGEGGDPDGEFRALVDRDSARSPRGGATCARRRSPLAAGRRRPTTGTSAASSTTSATPEHVPGLERDAARRARRLRARLLPRLQTDRPSYVDAFFENLDWTSSRGGTPRIRSRPESPHTAVTP